MNLFIGSKNEVISWRGCDVGDNRGEWLKAPRALYCCVCGDLVFPHGFIVDCQSCLNFPICSESQLNGKRGVCFDCGTSLVADVIADIEFKHA